ncbi:MAG: hypothetical protein N3D76_08885 [Geminocystis sp.]|nr:hypothetical protein [Geminocystis sp.]
MVAIITGAISIFLGLVYLVLVELLDLRGGMQPAPLQFSLPWWLII